MKLLDGKTELDIGKLADGAIDETKELDGTGALGGTGPLEGCMLEGGALDMLGRTELEGAGNELLGANPLELCG